jgi:hypothetical protein
MSQYYQLGNTVRLIAQFSDWDGNPVDPALIKIKFYDVYFKKIDEQSVGVGSKIDVGSYYFDYVPDTTGTFIYEWYGEIEGNPSLQRETISIKKY